jgi:hypothetical protein
MHIFAPEGFSKRKPEAKKTHCVQLTSTGPNEEWCGDGHDKLNKIGIEIYGIRDKASGYWLGLWPVPNNRIKEVVAYLYLLLIEERNGKTQLNIAMLYPNSQLILGIPIKSTTDCGSETTLQFGFAHALQYVTSQFLVKCAQVPIPPGKDITLTTTKLDWLLINFCGVYIIL